MSVRVRGRRVIITQHCAILGQLSSEVHDFRVFEPETCDGRTTVRVVCTGVWGPYDLMVVPDDTRYLTITCNGAMLYDSRSDVPVDLEKWAMTWAAHHHRRH